MDYSENLYDVEIFLHDGSCVFVWNYTMKDCLDLISEYQCIDSVYIMEHDPYNKINLDCIDKSKKGIESDEL